VVEDRGTGMSEEMLRRAGEPFFTTKEPGRGMGLGLFLVRLVAERCGAEFSMESKVGVGTRCVLEVADGGNSQTKMEDGG
jgi:two-component system sensor histidine kinase RegB